MKPITEYDYSHPCVKRIFQILNEKLKMDNAALETQHKKQKAKEQKRKSIMEKYSINKPIYENCQILAPDGEILCKCDRKKIDWYLTKELATKISEDPIIIKLNFEPNGRGISTYKGYKGDPEQDNQYYVEYKKNQCVVCGKQENYLRFQIVPAKYRCFFPQKYKSHRSHDVLLLCFDCNEEAVKKQNQLKKQLSVEYDVPNDVMDEGYKTMQQLEELKKSSKAMIKGKDKIPQDRLQEMHTKLCERARELFEKDTVSEEQKEILSLFTTEAQEIDYLNLRKLMNIKIDKITLTSNKRKNLHGKYILEKLGGDEAIPEFIRMWRKNFLDTMQPKFLPNNWSIDHSIERTFGVNSRFYTPE